MFGILNSVALFAFPWFAVVQGFSWQALVLVMLGIISWDTWSVLFDEEFTEK